MLLTHYYLFKRVYGSMSKQMPSLQQLFGLMDDLLFSLCNCDLPSSSAGVAQRTLQPINKLKIFFDENPVLHQTLYGLLTAVKSNETVLFRPEEISLDRPLRVGLKQSFTDLGEFFKNIRSLQPSDIALELYIEQSQGLFPYTDKRDELEGLGIKLLRYIGGYGNGIFNFFTVAYPTLSPKDYRELFDKLLKIPLPSKVMTHLMDAARDNATILIDRYQEIMAEEKYLRLPELMELYQLLDNRLAPSVSCELTAIVLISHHIPISYLTNLLSIALLLKDKAPILISQLLRVGPDFSAVKAIAFELMLGVDSNVPLQELEQLACGRPRQVRLNFDSRLNSESPIKEIADRIIKKYYLPAYPGQQVVANQLTRFYHGFDHASRCLILFQLLVRFLQEYDPKALRNPKGEPLSKRELRLLEIAVLCHDAANSNESFKNEAAQAAIFRAEALSLGFTLDEVQPIGWALENKDNKAVARTIYQWLIHAPDCLEFMRVIQNNLKDFRIQELDLYQYFIATQNNLALSKLSAFVEYYKKFIPRFMACNRLQMQSSASPFLATQAAFYKVVVHLALGDSNIRIPGDPKDWEGYLLLDYIDPLLIFESGSEWLRSALRVLTLGGNGQEQLKSTDSHEPIPGMVRDSRRIIFDMYSILSNQLSAETIGNLARYHSQVPAENVKTAFLLLQNYITNKNLKNVFNLPGLTQLWSYALYDFNDDKQFYGFIKDFLLNAKLDSPSLPNIISMATHLTHTPYLQEFIEAVSKSNSMELYNQASVLLDQAYMFKYSKKPVEAKNNLFTSSLQIKYPGQVFHKNKYIDYRSPIEDIARYILEKYYLKPYPLRPSGHSIFRPMRGFDHILRCLFIFQLWLRLLEEFAPKELSSITLKDDKSTVFQLLQLAILCHEAANTSDAFNDEDAHVKIFRAEAEILGFPMHALDVIADALRTKDRSSKPIDIFKLLLHDPDCLDYMRHLKDQKLFRIEELYLFQHFQDTKNDPAIAKLQAIVSHYKRLIIDFMSSDILALQQHADCFNATKAIMYQLALYYSANTTERISLRPNCDFLELGEIDQIQLFTPDSNLLYSLAEKINDSYEQQPDSASSLFENEGVFFRVVAPQSWTSSPRMYQEETRLNTNKSIIANTLLDSSADRNTLWQSYEQKKLLGLNFRPATRIKKGIPIMPYNNNRNVALLIRNNDKALKFFKSNIGSNLIAQGNFNLQRTIDGYKGLDSEVDLDQKLTEANQRRLGNRPDVYNRYHGLCYFERNEILLANYDLKETLGIHVPIDNANKDVLLEALFWYIRLALVHKKKPNLFYYSPFLGGLTLIPYKDFIAYIKRNVPIPAISAISSRINNTFLLGDPAYDAINLHHVSNAQITRSVISGKEVYDLTLLGGQSFKTTISESGHPVIEFKGKSKPVLDRKGILRHTIRTFQDKTAEACRGLLLEHKDHFKAKYFVESITIHIEHQAKNYPNSVREKNCLYVQAIFQLIAGTRFYCEKLQDLLGIKIDPKTIEYAMGDCKVTLRHRIPHDIIHVMEKIQKEVRLLTDKEEESLYAGMRSLFQH